MRIYLCSFANKAISKSFLRLRKQAEEMNMFDEIYFYTESDLSKDFKKQFKKQLIPYSRGFGFWCWKPQIISQTLEKMDVGDILLYMDAGSHLNVRGKERLLEYVDIVDKAPTGILAFRSPEHLESKLTKMDIFNYFGVASDKFYTDTTQIEGGHIFIKKNDISLSFVKKWQEAYNIDFSLVTDEPSRSKNFDNFVDNRHDQSLFSILGKKYNITTLSTDETYSIDWATMTKFPLLAKRDIVYQSKIHLKHKRELGGIYRRLWKLLYR